MINYQRSDCLFSNLMLQRFPSFRIFQTKFRFLHYRPSSLASTSRMMECEVIGFDGEDRSSKGALIHPAPPLLLVLRKPPLGVDCWLTTEWLFGMLRGPCYSALIPIMSRDQFILSKSRDRSLSITLLISIIG
jgi:hypothetical protein